MALVFSLAPLPMGGNERHEACAHLRAACASPPRFVLTGVTASGTCPPPCNGHQQSAADMVLIGVTASGTCPSPSRSGMRLVPAPPRFVITGTNSLLLTDGPDRRHRQRYVPAT